MRQAPGTRRRAPAGAGLCGTTGHASRHRSLTRARTAVPWSLQNWTGTPAPPPPSALGRTSQAQPGHGGQDTSEHTPEARAGPRAAVPLSPLEAT